jgi:hypothetical protein
MTCPFCAKVITLTRRLDADPDAAAIDIEGVPFLCAGCHQLSLVVSDSAGHAVSLRHPTTEEAARLAASQHAANQLGPDVTLEALDEAMADLRDTLRRKPH